MRLIRRLLARFDEMVDNLDVYAPASRAGDHEMKGK